MAPSGHLAVIGEGFSQAHGEGGPQGGGHAYQEGGVGALREAGGGEEGGQGGDGAVHEAEKGRLDHLEDKALVLCVGEAESHTQEYRPGDSLLQVSIAYIKPIRLRTRSPKTQRATPA